MSWILTLGIAQWYDAIQIRSLHGAREFFCYILAFPHFSMRWTRYNRPHYNTWFFQVNRFVWTVHFHLFACVSTPLQSNNNRRAANLELFGSTKSVQRTDSRAHRTFRRSGAANTLKLTHCFTISSFKSCWFYTIKVLQEKKIKSFFVDS